MDTIWIYTSPVVSLGWIRGLLSTDIIMPTKWHGDIREHETF